MWLLLGFLKFVEKNLKKKTIQVFVKDLIKP